MSFIRFIRKYSHIPRVNTPVSVMAVPSASAAGVQKGPHCIQRLVTRPPAHLASLETTSFWSPWKVLNFGGGKMVHLTMGEPWSSSEYLLDKEPPTQTSGRVGEEPMTTKPPNLLGSFSAKTKWFISSHSWTLFTLLKSMMHRQVYMNCATEEEKFNQLCNVPPPICLTSRDRFELSLKEI